MFDRKRRDAVEAKTIESGFFYPAFGSSLPGFMASSHRGPSDKTLGYCHRSVLTRRAIRASYRRELWGVCIKRASLLSVTAYSSSLLRPALSTRWRSAMAG